MKLALLFALLSFPAFAGAAPALEYLPEGLVCQKTLFRYAYSGANHEEPASLCFDETRSVLIAERCREGRCEALSEKICAAPAPANPSFESAELCRSVGGFPQIGAFFDGKEWWDMDRCLFERDKSFVDSGTLAARRAACYRNQGPIKPGTSSP